jgi:DivIVA domain-containing protein
MLQGDDEMPLTPADVRNKQFSTTRLRPGYDEEEVDAFLDEVEAELDRLIQDNEELRAKLAEVLRGGGGKAPVPAALNAPHIEPVPELMAAEPPRREPERRPEPVMMKPVEDNMDTAARVLALAQQTADQAIADARREADETLSRARREADDILTKARRQSEQITSDARARAESLERDAQERHRQAMGSLVQSREELERRVDDLRAFEREYRSRLKAYLEGQLRDLEAGAADSGVFPAISAATPSVPSGVGRMDVRGGQPSVAGSYGGVPEPVAHTAGGFHPSDAGQHDRR